MKKKTKQDFQELLKTEHCKIHLFDTVRFWLNVFPDNICHFNFTRQDIFFVYVLIDTDVDLLFSVPALLEGFEIRECISFIEEHINRQVLFPLTQRQFDIRAGEIIIMKIYIFFFLFSRSP